MIPKYYTHSQKSFNNNNIAFLNLLVILKKKLTIEHEICKKKIETIETFNFLYNNI